MDEQQETGQVEEGLETADGPPKAEGVDEDLRLWKRYKESGNPAVREKLILKFASFVKYVAGRMAINLPSNVEYDDLVSYGIFGLIDAIEKFDPARAVKFKTYAKTRIRGAILDELRVLDWTPRSIRQKSKQLERAYAQLETKLGRDATDEEVSNFLSISVNDLHRMFDDAKQSLMISLDEGDSEGDGGASRMDFLGDEHQLVSPERSAEHEEVKILLAREITRLSERERLVITLYYFEGLTSKEIGRILGVSDSRISQLHTKAILRLKGRLGKMRTVLSD